MNKTDRKTDISICHLIKVIQQNLLKNIKYFFGKVFTESFLGSNNRTNSSAPWQPEKDLPQHLTAADRHSNIGMFKHWYLYLSYTMPKLERADV